jgi:class 3 adenylate cyclase/tetratricopeptide (TPR) repeat protein
MTQACANCGQQNPQGARYCNACGAALMPDTADVREERKVVTVLFCDLVGSTAQAERIDPEDVWASLSRYRERVRAELERFGGTVEKFIGDAVMALFGAPAAHEDDPERAVRAALAIRTWADEQGELQVRIGITTGEALVALSARPAAGEGMASGDVVNTAARLQSAAPVNGIFVDETTYRASERSIEYLEHQPVQAKGKAEPIQVWEAARERAPLGADLRRTRHTPLVGRVRELDELANALERAKQDREPQLVTMVGVPGIGKSRLLWELFQRVAKDPEAVTWRQGRSLPYGEGVSFWALAEMIKAQAGILETDSSEETATKLSRTIAPLIADAADARRVESHLRPLLGLETDEVIRGDRRGEAFAAWRRFFEALAEQGPLILIFEDLHFADDGLLDFVDYLVEWASGVPLLVVGTARPELLTRRPAWAGGKPNSTILTLSPLTDGETARIVAALLDRAISADVSEALLARAGGNPLYAEEFARLVTEGRQPEVLPESVQGIISARLDGLGSAEKTLLQDASVLGKVFWLGSVVYTSGEQPSVVEERLHTLERREFVRRERRSSVAGETEYAFRHVLVRDVAYSSIPRAARGEKHVLAAEWIESLDGRDDHADMLAHHYVSALELFGAAGRDVADLAERAVPALGRAGDRALSLNALGAAIRLYRKALELLPAGHAARSQFFFRLGRALWMAEARGEEELIAARDGLLESGDRASAAESEAFLAEMYWNRGDRDRSSAHVAAAAALARDLERSSAKAYVLTSVSRNLARAGRIEDAIAAGRQAVALAEELGLDDIRAFALNSLGVALAGEGDPTSVPMIEEAIRVALSIGSHEAIRGYVNIAHDLRHDGELNRSSEMLAEALRLSERLGSTPYRRFIDGLLPHIRYRQGRWDESLDLAQNFLDEVHGTHYNVWQALGTRALIRLARDDERGLDDAVASLDDARRSADYDVLTAALALHARALILAGRNDEAAQTVEEASSRLDVTRTRPGFDLPLLVVSAFDVGDDGNRVLPHARPGKWADAARLYFSGDFVGAANVYRDIGSATDEAEARLRAARALRDAGKRAEADAQLEEALAFYRGVRATLLVRRAEALLAATP